MNISSLLKILDTCERPELRKPFLESVLAVELGYSLSLPSAKVESVVAHFEQFHAEAVKRVIGEVNEMYPLAVNVVYNMVVDVYKNRYTICHEPRLISCEDIAAQLSRPAFQASVDAVHAEVMCLNNALLLRSDVGQFIRRFITE
ncbi:hypothetical protein D3C85_14840 [compost metagenome]